MRLLVNGKEVPFIGLASCESLDQYYPYYLLTVPAAIRATKVQLVDKISSTYYILRGELKNKVYIYTIVLDSVYQILNRTYPSYTGLTTLQGLLSTLSIKNDIKSSTGIVYWRVPTYKFTGILNYLSKFTVVTGGGAPKFFLDLNGVLQLYDLRQILSRNNPTKITSMGFTEDQSMSDWILRDVGAVDIHTGLTSERFTVESDAGLGSSFINDTTGFESELVKRFITSRYYLKKYTARKVTLKQSAYNLSVGELVVVDDTTKFVVYSRSATIPLSDEQAQVSYVLVSAV